MTKRAVLYARVSGDDRGKPGDNLAGQIEMCRDYALSKGYRIIAELAEDERGATGASLDLEKLNQVREMAKNAEFDVLVVREIDRFARSLAKQLIVEEELKRAGVEIDYVLGDYPDTPEGNLMKNVKASVAEYERLKIAERTTRAKRRTVSRGNVIVSGRPPFGYELVELDGKRTLAIHESESKIIRVIFEWYVKDGMSIKAITAKLSELRVPTATDRGTRPGGGPKKKGYGEWRRCVVHKILKRETYAGVWHYGKRKRLEDGTGPWVHNSRETWLPVQVPAIIDRDVWEVAQERLKKNHRAPRGHKHNYLLSGRVTCGHCRATVSGTTFRSRGKVYQYYRCGASKVVQSIDYTYVCDLRSFRVQWVDAEVWEWIKELISDPDVLAVELHSAQAEQEEVKKPLREQLAVVDDLLADNRRQLEKLLDLYLSSDFDKSLLLERKSRLEHTIERLEEERATLVSSLEADALTNQQIRNVLDFAEVVRKGLDRAEREFDKRREIIEVLNVQAIFEIQDGKKLVRVSCVLGEKVLGESSTTPIGSRHYSKPFLALTTVITLEPPARRKRDGQSITRVNNTDPSGSKPNLTVSIWQASTNSRRRLREWSPASIVLDSPTQRKQTEAV